MSASTDNWSQIERASRDALPEHIVAMIENIRANEAHPESRLISVLHKVQEHFGHLGREQMDAVAQLLQVPAAVVTGVASFYHYFRLQPRGKHMLRVCMGTACYVKGAERVADKLKEELGIDFGETTTDNQFSLEGSRCLGSCGLAPVVMVDDNVHGPMTPDKVPALLERYMRES